MVVVALRQASVGGALMVWRGSNGRALKRNELGYESGMSNDLLVVILLKCLRARRCLRRRSLEEGWSEDGEGDGRGGSHGAPIRPIRADPTVTPSVPCDSTDPPGLLPYAFFFSSSTRAARTSVSTSQLAISSLPTRGVGQPRLLMARTPYPLAVATTCSFVSGTRIL